MAVSFTKFPWLLWLGGKEKEQVSNVSGGGGGVNLFPDMVGLREPENLRFRSVLGAKKMTSSSSSSSSRKVKRKWKSREDRRRNRIDKEYDVVLVPSDGVCLSGSESDDSDWSVGWLEPHAPGFQSDDEGDNSFAVLVPCYRHAFKVKDEGDFEEQTSNQFLSAVMNLPNDYSSDGKKYMEQWLSSLQNF
ncbi:hypothetical protein LIER_11262 [Lithospermum erythrorhizon]|uniref:Uncharacterized protein n=1 Tax=Lithospermum erythrorhizon TaxID=34254 RepID=A0AAV3PPR7_LITER